MAKTIKTTFVKGGVGGIQIKSNYKCKNGYYTPKDARSIDYVTVHFTGNKNDRALSNAKYYRDSINRQASAHFFVDDSEIYQSVAMKDVAWSVGANKYYHDKCRNSNQLSIELCCSDGKPSDKTIVVGSYLCAYLMKSIGHTPTEVDKYVLRHYDVTHKECPYKKTWIKKTDHWDRFRSYTKSIMGATYQVNSADGLNMRTDATINSEIKCAIPYGAKVQCYTYKTVNGNAWGKILYNGLCGWVNLHYTTKL